ncbi:GNAT family N-acetyltransferase [Siccirubricoccus sp. G192]|uniref:GNAT family N-acetyltransferase n=1 Tax=Siccirubricoccus sp. G192 TaxID=2849651 RepID=UPI001C2C2045|nr:GNAT family N-acetyltransferase [Siccirubricoccus sp. G192]MBV1799984.1 GNAT family N-acetyltransferase [Siccirubricoccus sp. G192]
MRCVTSPGTSLGARLVPVPRTGLPAWCDRFLAPPGSGDFFAGRAFHDTTLAHALPDEAEPLVAACGEVALLPLLRTGGRLQNLATPYTLAWRPLLAEGADPAALRQAGHGFGRLLRGGPPARLEALDAEAPGLDAFLAGLGAAGLALHRYRHFGNWHEALPPGLGWAAYLAARPPALRTTIGRKLARCGREMHFELHTAPGAALDAGIAAYEDVRARSWKPHEPFPAFDAALMRAAARLGMLRLGLLRGRGDGRPAAAQYWIADGGRAWLLKLAHAEESRAASPGTALTAMMIRGLLEEDGVRELDFGRGDDPYKQLWVGRRRQRIGLVVADPRHPAGLLAVARQVAGRGRQRLLGWLGRGDEAGSDHRP